jgi:hypothetical protein
MRRILYLIDQPFDERNFERFGIQTWIARNWTVEVWDLTPWAYPGVWRDFTSMGRRPREFPGYRTIASRRDLRRSCSMSDGHRYFIDLTGDDLQALWAKWSLMRGGAVRIICNLGTIPAADGIRQRSIAARLKSLLGKGVVGTFKWLRNALLCRLAAPLVQPGIAVVSGSKSVAAAGHIREIIKAHSFDYDIYLRLRRTSPRAAGSYAVFIDQDYCFHPEYINLGIPTLVTPEKYFPAVCAGLRSIADALKLEMRIAAHPRATYRQRGLDFFQGLPIEYGRTAELIQGCGAVVCHGSTAIQFAVLFGKAAIFVTTDELARTSEGQSVVEMAAEFGKSVVNLDADLAAVDWQRQVSVDLRKYADYRSKYIKSEGSPETSLWQIVIDHIEQSYDRRATDTAPQAAARANRLAAQPHFPNEERHR